MPSTISCLKSSGSVDLDHSQRDIVGQNSKSTMLDAALAYSRLGMTVVPLFEDGTPIRGYKHWLTSPRHQTQQYLQGQFDWRQCRGIALLTGSNNLLALDLDTSNLELQANIRRAFNIPDDYAWRIASGGGQQHETILLHTTVPSSLESPSTLWFDRENGEHIEVKCRALITVPPSRHREAPHRIYRFIGSDDVPKTPLLERGIAEIHLVLEKFGTFKTAAKRKRVEHAAVSQDPDVAEALRRFDLVEYLLDNTENGGDTRKESDSNIRIVGGSGLLVNRDGDGESEWYSFSQETGGGVLQAIAWVRHNTTDFNSLTPQDKWNAFEELHQVSGVSFEGHGTKPAVTQNRSEVSNTPVSPTGNTVEHRDVRAKPESRAVEYLDLAAYKNVTVMPTPNLISSLYKRQSLNIIGGDEGEGKSLLAMQQGLEICRGGVWLDNPAWAIEAKESRVLYLDNEIGRAEFLNRAKLQGIANLKPGQFIYMDDVPPWEEYAGELERKLAELRPAITYIDSLYLFHSLDESQAKDMKQMLQGLKALTKKFDTAINLLHHPRKGTKYQEMDSHFLSGTGAFSRIMNTILLIKTSALDHNCVVMKPTKLRNFSKRCKEPHLLRFDDTTLTFRDLGVCDEQEHTPQIQGEAHMSRITVDQLVAAFEGHYDARRKDLHQKLAHLASEPTIDRAIEKAEQQGCLEKAGYGVYRCLLNKPPDAPVEPDDVAERYLKLGATESKFPRDNVMKRK